MKASTRTPEGDPNRCTVCGKAFVLEPSTPPGDGTCPYCGHLLWWFRARLSNTLDVPSQQVSLASSFQALGADSLDIVELVMDLEEKFGISISDSDAESIRTVADAIRCINRYKFGKPAA